MHRHQGDELVEVALDDQDAPTTEDSAPPAGDEGPRRPWWRRPVVLVAAAVVVVVVGVDAVQVRSEAAYRDSLAGLPGVLSGSLADPIAEVWSRTGVEAIATDAGVLVVGTSGSGLEGLDLTTGDVRWTRPSTERDGWCSGLPDLDEGTGWFNASHLVCLDGAPIASTVRVLETGTGREQGGVEVKAGAFSWQRAGDVLVVSGESVVDPDHGADDAGEAGVDVVAWDLAAAEERWRWSGEGLPEGAVAQVSGFADDAVLVQDVRDGVHGGLLGSLDLGTGAFAPGDRHSVPTFGRTVELADGLRVTTGLDTDPAGPGAVVRVTDEQGEVLLERPGYLGSAFLDDGAADPLLVRDPSTGRTTAVDVRTDRDLWSTGGPGEQTQHIVLAQLDGVVVSQDVDGPTVVRDGRTGEELWRRAGFDVASVVTDGRRLLLVRPGPEAELVALDLRSGTQEWAVGVGATVNGVMVVDGALVVTGPGSVRVLGRARG